MSSEHCGIELMAAHEAGDTDAVRAILGRYPRKIRDGLRAILTLRKDPEALRRKLVTLGFDAAKIGPLPTLDPGK